MSNQIKHHCPPCEGKQDFECVLANLSASFVNVQPAALDERINAAIQEMGHYLGVDLADIWLLDDDDDQFRLSYQWTTEGVEPQPETMNEGDFPYLTQCMRAGQTVVVDRLAELPALAAIDQRSLQSVGIKSLVCLPLAAGGVNLGVMSFNACVVPTRWPSAFVIRLQLIGEIFANALLQCRNQQALQRTLAENEKLRERLEAENEVLQEEVYHTHEYESVIGKSPALRRILSELDQVAPTKSTVLLLGETGTGKDLIANHIHLRSGRAHEALIRVNCAALPEALLESELFGHEKGAFTGAERRKIGRLELADGATLVLDEIGELPLRCQPKLLRALQNGEFERLGSGETRKVDVRLIASTNRDLEEMAQAGTFRQDLFYRLNVFPITVPPLRERKEDIPLLVEYFVEKLQNDVNKKITQILDEALEELLAYHWPGNIRELQNVVERSLILSSGSTLTVEGLLRSDESARPASVPVGGDGAGNQIVRTLDEVNHDYIRAVCVRCRWKIHGKGNAADLLGINPNTLRARMKKLGVERPAMAS